MNGDDMISEGSPLPGESPAEYLARMNHSNPAVADAPQVDQETISNENLDLINYIQLSRIYDVGLAILRELNSEAADNLFDYHVRGEFIGPSPALAEGDDE